MRPIGPHKDLITDLIVSPDGEVIATSGKDKTVGLWQVPNATRQHQDLRPPTNNTGYNPPANRTSFLRKWVMFSR